MFRRPINDSSCSSACSDILEGSFLRNGRQFRARDNVSNNLKFIGGIFAFIMRVHGTLSVKLGLYSSRCISSSFLFSLFVQALTPPWSQTFTP